MDCDVSICVWMCLNSMSLTILTAENNIFRWDWNHPQLGSLWPWQLPIRGKTPRLWVKATWKTWPQIVYFFRILQWLGYPVLSHAPSKKFSRDVVTARRFDLHPLDGWTSESHEWPGAHSNCQRHGTNVFSYKDGVSWCIHVGVSINGGTQNRWFRMENTIKMDDGGVPPILGQLHVYPKTIVNCCFKKWWYTHWWYLWLVIWLTFLQHWKTSPWTDEPETRCLQKAVFFNFGGEICHNLGELLYSKLFENIRECLRYLIFEICHGTCKLIRWVFTASCWCIRFNAPRWTDRACPKLFLVSGVVDSLPSFGGWSMYPLVSCHAKSIVDCWRVLHGTIRVCSWF